MCAFEEKGVSVVFLSLVPVSPLVIYLDLTCHLDTCVYTPICYLHSQVLDTWYCIVPELITAPIGIQDTQRDVQWKR